LLGVDASFNDDAFATRKCLNHFLAFKLGVFEGSLVIAVVLQMDLVVLLVAGVVE